MGDLEKQKRVYEFYQLKKKVVLDNCQTSNQLLSSYVDMFDVYPLMYNKISSWDNTNEEETINLDFCMKQLLKVIQKNDAEYSTAEYEKYFFDKYQDKK